MNATRRSTTASPAKTVIFAILAGFCAPAADGQEVTYEERNGVRYQVTRRVVQRQVPTTVMQDRQQTVLTPQIVTDTVNHQQLYNVPVTQYQLTSQLKGRWNPFVTPYWTYKLEPVTRWHQQVASVPVPVSRMSWVQQTRTVQVPVTEYRTAEEETISRVAVSGGGGRTLASNQAAPSGGSRPASIAARQNSGPIGGVALDNDPPREGTGWQAPSNSGYRR